MLEEPPKNGLPEEQSQRLAGERLHNKKIQKILGKDEQYVSMLLSQLAVEHGEGKVQRVAGKRAEGLPMVPVGPEQPQVPAYLRFRTSFTI